MFLDIAIGIFISILTSQVFELPISLSLILAAILFALLPDADFIFYLAKNKKTDEKSHRHRDLLHYPLVYLLVGGAIILFFGPIWLFIFALASFWHFLHDSFLGWGVRWLWPFDWSYYLIFRWPVAREKKFPFILFRRLSPAQAEKMAADFGDPDWLKNIYLRPSGILIIEFLFLALAIFVLLFYR